MPDDVCDAKPSVACRTVWNVSHNDEVTRFFHTWLDGIVTALIWAVLAFGVALAVRHFAHKVITRITGRMANGAVPGRFRERLEGSQLLAHERRRQRMETLGSVLRSIASVVIFGTALFTVLGEMGLNLTPVLASATVVGAAVGFGAQNTIKDLLAGLFMLLEDQYGVGDVVDTGTAKGTVESVSLRITRLRDVNGVVWYVRNGEITRLGNESQNWGRALLDLPVAPDQDIDEVRDLIQKAADELVADKDWKTFILEDPSVWGVQALTNDAMVIRVTIKTAPNRQAEVARELRVRVKKSFDEAGIALGTLA
ncbi:mechanosensitive ion channel family protein [Actinocorallia sp. A-T 12471]|uniref:mechanosensitive ion channel family protein n=1 Tax=Actinocorallia sp. A-T 12471 TaxID=3089813 RepID=UPI0029CC70F2|nr:mechanosensitive ion channel family protein [Actinocorallia sp. A-T 12471]MDX6742893.1 mechanosensitive ion channel family protein [Actinocorallia sp. A-T 12471]